MKPLLWGVATLSLATSLVAAPVISLDTVKIQGWEPAGEVETYVGEKLYDAIDGFADFHFGFDFKEAHRRFFQQGDKRLEVFVYRFGSAAEAYGLYSVMRSPLGQRADSGDEAFYEEPGTLHVWRGDYYLSIVSQGQATPSREEMLAFTQALVGPVEEKTKPPRLIQTLPQENLRAESLLYFHCKQPLDRAFYLGDGNPLLLAEEPTQPHDVQAALAEFTLGGRRHSVIAALYPTKEKATQARALCLQAWQAEAVETITEEPWSDLKAKNGKHTLIYQRERWLLAALEVVQVEPMKAILLKIDAALWKQEQAEKAKQSDQVTR